jgi:hypothetical protein
MAQTASLIYVIADYSLYGFDSATNSYILLIPLDHYQSYSIQDDKNHLIISGYNFTTSSLGYSIVERVWIIIDGIILDSFDMQAIKNPTPSITLIASPFFTKIFYFYINTNGQTMIGVKSVDFI